jgi:hypothetical protein
MNTANQKLAVIVLGKGNSGKSSTWYEIFGRVIRTGWKTLKLNSKTLKIFVKNSSFEETGMEIEEEVFVRNASFEEYGDEIEGYLDQNNLPMIIFCSVQYKEKGLRTIQWFKDHGYYLYIQWLNPGYNYVNGYSDFLGFEKQFSNYGFFEQHTGKENVLRAIAIKKFLYSWINNRTIQHTQFPNNKPNLST